MKRTFTLTAAAFVAALLAPAAFAQHAHSDVEFGTFPGGDANGAIVVDPEDLQETAGGLKIYETEFGTLSNPYTTDDPGFNNDEFLPGEPGAIEFGDGQGVDGTLLGWRLESDLRKWVGGAWVGTGFNETITFFSDASGDSTAASAGSGAGGTGRIDQFAGGGGLHTHIDFTISSSAGDPMFGAYLVQMALIGYADAGSAPSSAYVDSDPFWMAFGLIDEDFGTFTDEDFEMAISAIPLPAGVWLLGSAIIGLAGAGRRARRTA